VLVDNASGAINVILRTLDPPLGACKGFRAIGLGMGVWSLFRRGGGSCLRWFPKPHLCKTLGINRVMTTKEDSS
jgi:hypothetical protein